MTDLEKHLAKIDAAIAKAKAAEAATIREINGLPGVGGLKGEQPGAERGKSLPVRLRSR